ncbi:hypothetical protein T11_16881 [Trichinella zimbabwensis]|uniref:Uncharacterized protein n=1 Tax=Trichinella zimbabwensis TaxID=268475 RepID=A0A0V1HWT5_9BILA|nr:hypothetical protein T11_16881 [Trichinella zimbabwensis]
MYVCITVKLVINVQFHYCSTQAQLNNISGHGKIERVMILQYDERNSGKKKKKREKKETTLKTLLQKDVGISDAEKEEKIPSRHRTFTDPLGHRITEHISLCCSWSSSMSSYCRHNASSYFTDKLTLIATSDWPDCASFALFTRCLAEWSAFVGVVIGNM